MDLQELKKKTPSELISQAEKLGTDKAEVGVMAYTIRD